VSPALLAHTSGLVALGLTVTGSIHRCDKRLRRNNVLAALCWAANFLVLGAMSGALLSGVSAARTASASLVQGRDARVRLLLCTLFVTLSVGVGLYAWDGSTAGLLPPSASTLMAFAMFYLSGARLRMAVLASALLWTQYAIQLDSLEQLAGCLMGVAAASIGLWRLRSSEAGL
jgi:hypothetical protein